MQWHEQSVCVVQSLLLRMSEHARQCLWFRHFRTNDLV